MRLIYYATICVYVGILVFLAVSLCSYNPTDSSWLYVTSEVGTVSNAGGFLGAHIAALLFYIFGGASFLISVVCVCLGWLLITEKSLRRHWERILAAVYVVCVGAMMLATYQVDLMCSPYPGGVVGLVGAQKLGYYGDAIGRVLFLYTSVCASFIVLFQWSFMRMVHYGMVIVVAWYALMKKHRVINKVGYAVYKCLHVICG
jgi:DNA segregation ATPase FtsK/SpoIIIE, S-DNA-T family